METSPCVEFEEADENDSSVLEVGVQSDQHFDNGTKFKYPFSNLLLDMKISKPADDYITREVNKDLKRNKMVLSKNCKYTRLEDFLRKYLRIDLKSVSRPEEEEEIEESEGTIIDDEPSQENITVFVKPKKEKLYGYVDESCEYCRAKEEEWLGPEEMEDSCEVHLTLEDARKFHHHLVQCGGMRALVDYMRKLLDGEEKPELLFQIGYAEKWKDESDLLLCYNYLKQILEELGDPDVLEREICRMFLVQGRRHDESKDLFSLSDDKYAEMQEEE